MWIVDHLRGIDNPRSNLCIRWQGHATSCMPVWPGEGMGMDFRGLADSWREPLICGIPVS